MRQLLVGLGVVTAGLGFAMLVDRGLASAFRTSQIFLVVLGGIAVVQTYRVIRGRRRTEIEITETDDPETEQDLPVPGEDFDGTVRNMRGLRRPDGRYREAGRNRYVRARDRINERLETAAVETIVRKSGCTEREAREALEAGTWTDDPVAAAYFTGKLEETSLRRRIGLALSSEARHQRRANRAARAIADLAERDDVRPEGVVPE